MGFYLLWMMLKIKGEQVATKVVNKRSMGNAEVGCFHIKMENSIGQEH